MSELADRIESALRDWRLGEQQHHWPNSLEAVLGFAESEGMLAEPDKWLRSLAEHVAATLKAHLVSTD